MTTRPEVTSSDVAAQVSKSIDNLADEFETLLGKDAPALRVIQHLAASFRPHVPEPRPRPAAWASGARPFLLRRPLSSSRPTRSSRSSSDASS